MSRFKTITCYMVLSVSFNLDCQIFDSQCSTKGINIPVNGHCQGKDREGQQYGFSNNFPILRKSLIREIIFGFKGIEDDYSLPSQKARF